MTTPSTKITPKYWHKTYLKMHEIPELGTSMERSSEIAQKGGWEEDPHQVAEVLMDHPFTGFFYGFLDEQKSAYQVSIIHHAFRMEPGGVDFDMNTQMVYGIEGLDNQSVISEITADIFEPSGDRTEGFHTPNIKDFISAVGDTDKIKSLSAVEKFSATKEALRSGYTNDEDSIPIPIVLPRRFGIIPPVLMPAFQEPSPESILPDCLTLIAEFGENFLNEEGRKEFWEACYPTLQLLWILCMEPNSHEKLDMYLIKEKPIHTKNAWAFKKGMAIEKLYVAKPKKTVSIAQPNTVSQSQGDEESKNNPKTKRNKASDYFNLKEDDDPTEDIANAADEDNDDDASDDSDDDDTEVVFLSSSTSQPKKKIKQPRNESSSFDKDFMREMLITTRDNQAALVDLVRDGIGGGGGSSGVSAKWFKRFHLKMQFFICLVSAHDPTVAPEEPRAEYKQLLESAQKSAAQLAQFNINQQRNGSQVVDNALALMIYNAAFIKTPNSEGLSMFYSVPAPNLVYGGAIQMGSDELNIRLQSNLLTDADVKKLTSSKIQIPKDEHAFMATMENHLILIDYLFEKGSMVYKSLDKLKKAIEDNKAAFASMVASDKKYLASLMAAIDIKYQLFFNSCAKASSIEQVHFQVLDLQSEIESFWFKRSLNVQLPYHVEQIVAAANKPPAEPADKQAAAAGKRGQGQDGEKRGRKKKKKEIGDVKPDVNKDPADASWITKPREATGVFQKNIATVPKLNGQSLCIKFHVQGSCPLGRTCLRCSTHTGNLDDETKNKMGAWVDKCRAEAKGGN